ncbi:MAG: rRNA maturation RNase YbeY [Ktedonobacteraceae bacterium]|nr:rRNA maturation RNase YbeY [Ktedonobacteraceae bacterium]
MQGNSQIELYVTVGDDQQNAALEEMLASIRLDAVVSSTLHQVGVTQQVMLTLLVTDDAAIQEMNTQYRQQDKPTDVLSFPLLDAPLVDAPTDQLWHPQEQNTPTFITPPETVMNLGDVVMSWPAILRQAQEAGHSPAYELLYLLSHGVLHLVGYDDQTEPGYQAMIRIQQAVLQEVGQET